MGRGFAGHVAHATRSFFFVVSALLLVLVALLLFLLLLLLLVAATALLLILLVLLALLFLVRVLVLLCHVRSPKPLAECGGRGHRLQRMVNHAWVGGYICVYACE